MIELTAPVAVLPPATNMQEEHTLTAFGDISLAEAQIQPSDLNSPRNRLRLKVKRPPFPKKRIVIHHQVHSIIATTSSPVPFLDAPRHSVRPGKQLGIQRSPSDAVESENPSQPHGVGERPLAPNPSNISSQVDDSQMGYAVVVQVPSVGESPQQSKGWRKLPPRLPIPKWDTDVS